MMDDVKITLGPIRRTNGIAGQYELAVDVTYTGDDWTETGRNAFVGSVYGGAIIAVSATGVQTFVVRDVMDRCGSLLTPEWVRRFYGIGV